MQENHFGFRSWKILHENYKPVIESDLALAHSLGFTQTPSFIIVKNYGSFPQQLLGPQPFPEFKSVIDKELGR